MTEPLFSALLLGAILLLVSPSDSLRATRTILLGALIGGCLLTREVAKMYPAIFGIGLWLLSKPIHKRVANLLLFSCGLVIVLLPWMWRNEIVWDHPLPLSYTSGPNLHIGNNPDATGLWMELPTPENIRFGTPEASQWHAQQAFAFIRTHPGRFLALGFKKLALFLFPTFHRDTLIETYNISPKLATWLSLPSGGLSAFLLLSGLAGFFLTKPDRFWWLALTIIAYSLAVTFVVYGYPRYRDPCDHLLIYYAALAITNWRTILPGLRSGSVFSRRKLWILVPAVFYLLFNWMWIVWTKIQ